MKEGFRQSMAWLHTWSGLLLGWLLFAIFLTGTASYFREEIDHWMRPDRHALDARALNLEKVVASLERQAPDAPSWTLTLPDERRPVVKAFWPGGEGRRFGSATLNPATGDALDEDATRGGEFFYAFHFQLWHVSPITGRIIVGLATLSMFVALITGIVTHKKIFKDFFTLRPRKGQRSWLDGHNVSAVLSLPFHLLITFSGLVMLMHIYMPWPGLAQYGQKQRLELYSELSPRVQPIPRSGQAAPLPALEPLLERARAHWNGVAVGGLVVHNPGDANARIEVLGSDGGHVSRMAPRLVFGADGQVLEEVRSPATVATLYHTLYGLHMGRFAEPLLRWLYIVCGLSGCFMIASGLVLWVVKRAAQSAKQAKADAGLRLVRALNVGALAGLPVAMAAYLWANRLLPAGLGERAAWEVHVFFITWSLALLHPWLRPHKRAWVEQLGLGAALLGGIPLLDLACGLLSLPGGWRYADWILGGFDLACLGLGVLLGWLAWKVARHRPPAKPVRGERPAKVAPTHRARAEAAPADGLAPAREIAG
ncbi:PepSY-associated TM helix domain-containing protein [Pseudomonas mangiferae]|uniref:PepSY domain-containing protein n=1 Tax=Pseudomonas mangiferae TaxID=2593654 RepID=A0A553GW48_9PSED|nr:PepSY-associated TM helix domain-containing protein [Pseudomonas mangiferae]TRX73696.1 PepSY domain-containing protein [Pseudomonas mangiferae]